MHNSDVWPPEEATPSQVDLMIKMVFLVRVRVKHANFHVVKRLCSAFH